eukprot:sb/3478085/
MNRDQKDKLNNYKIYDVTITVTGVSCQSNDVDFGPNKNIIDLIVIPLLGHSNRSLEPPKKFVTLYQMKKLSFWATPFYLYFQPEAKTISTLKIGVETNLRALK